MDNEDELWDDGVIDWPLSLRRLASRMSMDPRNSANTVSVAEGIYATAISQKAWVNISDSVYTEWAAMWYGILSALEFDQEVAWD